MKRILPVLVSLPMSVSLVLPALPGAADTPTITSLMERGRWKEARAAVEAQAKSRPDDPETHYLLARVRLAFGEGQAAFELAEKAATREPLNAAYRYQLAEACGYLAQRGGPLKQRSLAGRFKKEAEAVIQLDPRHVDARMALVQFHLVAPGIVGGDKKRARVLVEEVAKLDPVRGGMARAQLALQDKNEAAAESLYLQAVKLDPRSYAAQMALANFYRRDSQKKPERAERHARAALAIDPGRAGPYTVLAGIYAQAERWSDLEALLAEAERAVPGHLGPHYQAGRWLLMDGKDLPRAERYFRRYLTVEPEGGAPSLAHAHWRLGLVLEKQGKRSEAVAELEAALRSNPDLDEAKKDLKRLKRG